MQNVQRGATLLVIFFTLSCGGGSDGGNGPGDETPPAPAVTPVGTPLAAAVTEVIAAGGGTVIASDQRLTITLAAGAVPAGTTVGVQRISAEAPGAIGDGYRLTPEGITFGAPVTLTFHYDPVEMAGSAADLAAIAAQDSLGRWRWSSDPIVDTVAHTIAVEVAHFSDWTMLLGLQIRPPSATLQPGQSISLQVLDCGTFGDGEAASSVEFSVDCEQDAELPALPRYTVDAASWAVNGVRGGNTTFGRTAAVGIGATYTAPAQVPASNPVAVSVKARKRDGSVRLLVANILIAEESALFQVKLEFSQADGPVSAMSSVYGAATDETDFSIDANVGSDTPIGLVDDIVNGGTVVSGVHWFEQEGTVTPCKLELTGPFERFTMESGTTAIFHGTVDVELSGTASYPGANIGVPTDDECFVLEYLKVDLAAQFRFSFIPADIPTPGNVLIIPQDTDGFSVRITRVR